MLTFRLITLKHVHWDNFQILSYNVISVRVVLANSLYKHGAGISYVFKRFGGSNAFPSEEEIFYKGCNNPGRKL